MAGGPGGGSRLPSNGVAAGGGRSRTDSDGTDSDGTDSGGTESGGTDSDGTDSGGTESGGTDSGGTDSGGTDSGGTESGGSGEPTVTGPGRADRGSVRPGPSAGCDQWLTGAPIG